MIKKMRLARMFQRASVSMGAFGFAAAGLTGHADAAQIEMYFQATIESINDEFDGDARVGDFLEGTIVFETTTPESVPFPNNFPGAVTYFEINIIPDQGPNQGLLIPLLSDTTADIFVGTDSFEISYFIDIFTGNFNVSLQSGPAFNNSLVDAGNLLVQATNDSPTNDALDAFTDPFNNSSFGVQTDYTFGDAFATYNFVEFRVVPEPGSLGLLVLGGLCALRQRR